MALISTISTKELRRIAVRSYQTRTLWVRLCTLTTQSYDQDTLVSLWRTLEYTSGSNGYTPFSTTIGSGSYNGTTGRYELPEIIAAFTASGGTISYNRILIYVDDYTLEESLTSTGISFQTSGNTINRNSGTFIGTFSANEYVKVTGSSGGLNDGTYLITGVTATALTLSSTTLLPAAQGAGSSVTLQRALLYPYAILEEAPNIALANGQTQTYRIKLNTDNA